MKITIEDSGKFISVENSDVSLDSGIYETAYFLKVLLVAIGFSEETICEVLSPEGVVEETNE